LLLLIGIYIFKKTQERTKSEGDEQRGAGVTGADGDGNEETS